MEYQPIGEELSARSTFSDANKGATLTLNNRSTSSPCTEPVIDLLVREQRSESKRGGPLNQGAVLPESDGALRTNIGLLDYNMLISQ